MEAETMDFTRTEPAPRLYITKDKDGMHLWFAAVPPECPKGANIFQNQFAAGKIRLPVSWYGNYMKEGEIKAIDIADLFVKL